MKEKNLRIMIEYFDDDNRKHITVVNSFSDVKFLKERFCNKVSYNIIDSNNYQERGTGYIGMVMS